ncbi:MAG: hypothetical protein IPM98_06145 [Lewinellaceae bacterium]|nr:hypothetical protein [Lewinellaceae bacterium]
MTGSKMHNLDCNDNNNAIKPSATDLCGNGVDENCNGVTDENNLSLHFDGTNDYVSLGNILGNFGTGDFTIEARFKTTVANRYLLSKRPTCGCDNFFNIKINAAGKLIIEMIENASCGNAGELAGTSTVNDGNWHHFAFVRKSGVLSVFVDGTQENSTILTTNLNNTTVLSLGGNNPCVSPFSGEVDELHIWNIARTAEEINTFKNASLPAAVTGLLANYDFNNPTAIAGGNNAGKTLLDDRTANNYDGTLTNFALTGATSNWLSGPGGTTIYANARVKVFLQGPYVSTVQLMHDSLRVKNLIPLPEPYTGLASFTHTGGGGGETTTPAVLAVTGANAIVDWIFLELRSAANPALVQATRSALLQRDGDVVDVDGVLPVTFGVAANQSYFLTVRHRNHLGVQSGVAGLYPLCVTVESDFRSLPPGGFYAFNGLNPAQRLISGKYVLWAANGRIDFQLKYNGSNNDRNAILSVVGLLTPNAVVSGYRLQDYNMDGQVKYNGAANDRNVLLGNVGILTPSVVLEEQVAR